MKLGVPRGDAAVADLGLGRPGLPHHAEGSRRRLQPAQRGHRLRALLRQRAGAFVAHQLQAQRRRLPRRPTRPYVDAAEYPVITEYATGLAAFKAGQLHRFEVRAEDTLDTKKSVPDLSMYQSLLQMPTERHAPVLRLQDRRRRHVPRQAPAPGLLAVLDRDLFAETWYNVPKFTSQGLPVDTRLELARVKADEFAGWWLDPKGKDFGPNAKYYKHDLAEAKKLMAAAGLRQRRDLHLDPRRRQLRPGVRPPDRHHRGDGGGRGLQAARPTSSTTRTS